jgi:hypothetical protein
MAINESELAQMTCRAGLGRAGTMRAQCAPPNYELKAGPSGEILWNRPPPQDGDPIDNSTTYTRGKE